MAFLAEACFEVYTMFYCWPCYNMVSVSRNHRVTIYQLWGKFVIHSFVILVWQMWQFPSFIGKTYFYQYVHSFLSCGHCRNIANYFFSFVYPEPIIIWPQMHGWDPNWNKICGVFKWPSQISSFSATFLWAKTSKLVHMFPMLLVKSTISVISLKPFTFGFNYFWLARNDPYPQIEIGMFYRRT